MDLFTPTWWRAAGRRAAYTALAALLPLAALLFTGEVTPLYVASLVALAILASLATSLAGLPELTGKVVPWWRAIAIRVLKTAGQVAAPVFGSVLILEDVGWYELGVAVAGATLTTLVRALLAYLPEDADEVTITVGSDTLLQIDGRVVARTEVEDPATYAQPRAPGADDEPRHRAEV